MPQKVETTSNSLSDLQQPADVHPLMQNPDDRDPIRRRLKIYHMLLDRTSPVTGADMIATLRPFGRFGQISAGGRDAFGIAHCLRHSPSFRRIVENIFQIALCGGREAIVSHIARLCVP